MQGLREALESAYNEDEELDIDNIDESAKLQGTDIHDEPKDESITPEPKDEELEAKKALDGEKPTEKSAPKDGDRVSDRPTEVKAEKPPVGWSPKNREHWATLPNELKEQISKREREVNEVLQNSANARRHEDAFKQTVEPYRALMVAQGVDNPFVAIDGLMKTAATLQMGNQQQKAHRIAELIHHYGVDINALDSVLAGEQVPTQQQDPNAAIQEAVNRALAPFTQQQQQESQRQEYEMRQRVGQNIQKVADREFFDDLRLDMADIMEMASKRGQVVTLEQAYDRAAALHPEISGVITSRRNSGNLAGKKMAGSSINGRRGGKVEAVKDLSLHDTLSTLWDGGELTG